MYFVQESTLSNFLRKDLFICKVVLKREKKIFHLQILQIHSPNACNNQG